MNEVLDKIREIVKGQPITLRDSIENWCIYLKYKIEDSHNLYPLQPLQQLAQERGLSFKISPTSDSGIMEISIGNIKFVTF